MRKLGVEGGNLPTKKDKTVTPANFLIAGCIGIFERQYKRAFTCNDMEEFKEIFGNHVNPSWYGYDVVQSFFSNVASSPAKMIIKSHVGFDGTDFDGVSAFKDVNDTNNPCLKIQDGYEEEECFGSSGNRTGYTIENGIRFDTLCAEAGTSASTSVEVDSVADVKIGDIIKMVATGGGGATVYKEVTNVDEINNTIHWSGTFHGTANLEIDDEIGVLGFMIKLYRKNLRGVIKQVEEDLTNTWLTMSSEVKDYYVGDVFKQSKVVKVTDLASASTLNELFPLDTVGIVFLETGTEGTNPTIASHFTPDLQAFNILPVRMLANAESVNEAVNKAGETYCKSRWDEPKWIANLPEDQNKSQLIKIGHRYQRSDDVMQINVANWLKVSDSFSNAESSPDRHVPNIGFVMGAWCRSIHNLGIHFIPAVYDIPLFGCNGVVGNTFEDNQDRTDLAMAGMNVIQHVTGAGILIRNFFTPSTTLEFSFGNGILMRSFIKVSGVDSLKDTENEPNSFNRIQNSGDAMHTFMFNLFRRGSTGHVMEGETFGVSRTDEGIMQTFDDVVQVKFDEVANPLAKVKAGERNINIWFHFPSPAGSIRINTGFLF